MRKIVSIVVLALLFSSCEEEVKFNDPGLQVLRDDVLFKGTQVTAYRSVDGAIRIEALAQDEEITLHTSNSNKGAYYMASTNVDNWAKYTSSFNDEVVNYSTRESLEPITEIANPILTGGTGYTSSNLAGTTNTGNGTGMSVKTTAVDGVIKSVKIVNAGSNYQAGNIITIQGGNSNAKFRILSEIKIDKYENGLISGSFKFNVKNSNNNLGGKELVNFQYGKFFNIPVIQE